MTDTNAAANIITSETCRQAEAMITKTRIRNLLDFLPLAVLLVYAVLLSWTVATTEIAFMWKHIVGLLALPVIVLAFARNHKAGVLVLGLTLCLGLFSLLSYNPVVTIFTLTVGGNLPVFYGQPVFLLWLLLHFVVSGRYYVGILTKRYREELYNSAGSNKPV